MEASIYRLRTRDVLVLCVLSLLLLGVLMVQSASTKLPDTSAMAALADSTATVPPTDSARPNGASSSTTTAVDWDWTGQAVKHMILAGVALAAFFFVGFTDYRWLAKRTAVSLGNPIVWFYLLTAALLVMTLVPGLGKSVNGARRWIGAGPVVFQPSELAKWAIVLMLAWLLTYHEAVRKRLGAFMLTWAAVGMMCLLVVIQDFGTAALLGLTAVLMMVAGRVRAWHLAVLLPPVLGAAYWFLSRTPYRWRRITSFTDPFANPEGEGYHMVQSLLSFASGGIFGKGLGNGVQKLGYLPEDTTDFIFAVICEELGLFGALLTIVLYLGIAFVAWQLLRSNGEPSKEAAPLAPTPAAIPDPFARMLVFGVATVILLQAMINMAVATVSVPTKGMSLPLVSAGGSGLVITCMALGLLYSVARIQEREREPEELDLAEVSEPEPTGQSLATA